MNKETMNIHKALVELKTLESRINKGISGISFVVANKHANTKIAGMSIAEFCNGVKDDYASVTALIKRRDAIKRAVVLSNAVTKVTIGGVEYTVAEAIDMKNHGVEFLRCLLDKMSSMYKLAQRQCDMHNASLLDNANKHVTSMFGVTDLKNAGEEIEAERKHYIDANTYELVDPIKVKDEMEALEKRINEFLSDVDAALSVSNATNTIEVEY